METLADRIARGGPLNELDAVGWAIRLAKHLEALHAHGVAHGSISPACVLVQGTERSSKAILSDVRRTVESMPFHSPERIRDKNLSPADDTWALAATLYALMTGQPPFPGEGQELAQRISAGAAVPLAVYDVGDDELQRIIHQALAPSLAERVVQVSRLREALERWHPDPDVGRLPALEDDDVGDEHEAATAMLPQGAVMAFLDESTRAGTDEASEALFAEPDFADPSAPRKEDEATVMRELPAHIMAMAARAATGDRPSPLPAPPPPLPAAPSPSDGPPTGVTRVAPEASFDQPSAITYPTVPRPGPRAQPPAPRMVDAGMDRPTAPGPEPPAAARPPMRLPDDDDDVSTVLHRPPEEDHDEGDEARTVMRDAPVFSMDRPVPPAPGPPVSQRGGHREVPPPPPPAAVFGGAWAPAPPAQRFDEAPRPSGAAVPPPFPSGPGLEGGFAQPPGAPSPHEPTRPMFDSGPGHGGHDQPRTRPQMPSPVGFAAPDFRRAGPEAHERGGDPGVPRSAGFDAIAAELIQLPSQEVPPSSLPIDTGLAGPMYSAQAPSPFGTPPAGINPMEPANPSYPDSVAEGSSRSIYIVCLVALVVAAGLTYVLLRYRHQLGLPF